MPKRSKSEEDQGQWPEGVRRLDQDRWFAEEGQGQL